MRAEDHLDWCLDILLPAVQVQDVEAPKISKILGPDGMPLAYKPQTRPVGFVPLRERR